MTNLSSKGKVKVGVGVGILFILIVLVLNSLVKIPAGFVGVVYSPNGGVRDTVLTQGWHLVNPMNRVTEYTVSIEQVMLSDSSREGSTHDESFSVGTSDTKKIKINFMYSYRFDPSRVTDIFNNYRGLDGKTVEVAHIRGRVKTAVEEITSTFTLMEVYGTEVNKVNSAILDHLRSKFSKEGIIFETAGITERSVDKNTEDAIQKRVNNIQELESLKIDSEKAVVKAKNSLIDAEGKKAVGIIEAMTIAERRMIDAQSIADANAIIQKSISKDLLELKSIEKWNGVLPEVMTGNNSGTLMNIDLSK